MFRGVPKNEGEARGLWDLYIYIQYILTYPNPFVHAKNIFVRITEKFGYVKSIEKYVTESSITI